MSEVKKKIATLDEKCEMSPLLEDGIKDLYDLTTSLHSMARFKNNINWPKSRMHWLREGDAISKKIHGCMSNQRR